MRKTTANLKQRLRRQTKRMRQQIAAKDLIASGHLHVRTKVCGRPNCRCATDAAARHGPYYEWSRRRNGRQVSSTLTPQQAQIIEQAIANYREIMSLLEQWERETERLLLETGKERNG